MIILFKLWRARLLLSATKIEESSEFSLRTIPKPTNTTKCTHHILPLHFLLISHLTKTLPFQKLSDEPVITSLLNIRERNYKNNLNLYDANLQIYLQQLLEIGHVIEELVFNSFRKHVHFSLHLIVIVA